MKHNIFHLILIISIVFVSCKKDEPAPIASVEVTDLSIEASYTEANIQWTVTSSASVSEVVVEYSTDSAFAKFEQKQMSKVNPKSDDGQYKVSIAPLTEGTQYYVRCRAINRHSSYPSNAISIKTKAYHLPKVSTDSITSVTVSGATLYAQLVDWGTDTLPQMGFCLAKHAEATIADSCIECPQNEKKDSIIYSLTLNKLNDNTKYYVRAFARNHKGVAYGKELSFTTIEIVPPSVGNTAISNISYTTATATSEILADGGASVTERGICYSTSQNPTTSNTKITQGSGTGSFTCNMTGLTAGTKYYVRAYAKNSKGTSYGNEVTLTTTAYGLPTVTTSAVTNVSYTTATCGGNVTADGGQTVTERGICYSTSQNPTTSNTKITKGSGTGSFTCNMTGLTAGKKYYVRAYATNSKGTAYGNEVTFTTTAYSLPTVTTSAVTNVSYTTATCGGNVTADGGQTITERGICYSTSQNPTTSDTKITKGSGTGSFTCEITNLADGTTYYVRAYATNSKGTAYGEQKSFTTTAYALPTLTTSEVSNISYTTATCGGNVSADGGQTVTERGICYSTSQNPTTSNTKITKGNGTGSFTCNITGLTAGKKYYVRAYAKNSKGTSYGTQITFTTTAYGSPTVTTSAVTNITSTTATCGGNVTADGGTSVTERGICYSTSQNPTTSNTKITKGSGTGSFTCNMTGLTVGTTYYVRAYAKNGKGTSYGNQFTFTTTAYQAPTVTTQTPSNISYTTATCGGNVTADGGQTVTARGICYATSQNPTTSNSKVTGGSGTGAFSCNLTNLKAGTTYYVRAYAINSVGTSYGNQVVLSTTSPSAPTVTTGTSFACTSTTSMTCYGTVVSDNGASIVERGICWDMFSNPTINGSHSTANSGIGNFEVSITNLNMGASYHVRAYARNSEGLSYGEDVVVTMPSTPTFNNINAWGWLITTTPSRQYGIATTFTVIVGDGLEILAAGVYASRATAPLEDTATIETYQEPFFNGYFTNLHILCSLQSKNGTHYEYAGSASYLLSQSIAEYTYVRPYIETNIGKFWGAITSAPISY